MHIHAVGYGHSVGLCYYRDYLRARFTVKQFDSVELLTLS